MEHITIYWDNPEETLARMDFIHGWDFVEFREAMQGVGRMLASKRGAALGVIVDISRDTTPPSGAMPHFKQSIIQGGANPVPIVFVRDELVTRKLFETLQKTYKIERIIKFVPTIEDARTWFVTYAESLKKTET